MTTGILLINLGTPDAPTKNAIRRYLKKFLCDPYVITLPTALRYLLVYGLIVPFRAKKTARAYQHIWTSNGSPLLTNSKALQTQLSKQLGSDFVVTLGMRYGEPSIENAVKTLQEKQCGHVIVLPLFPQRANATTRSSLEKTQSVFKKTNYKPILSIIKDFYNQPFYIDASAEIIKTVLQSTPDFYLFSYHGLPKHQLNMPGNDCYRAQCNTTTQLIAAQLKLQPHQYLTTFQSRLGKTKWMEPYTDHCLTGLRKQGVKHLAIACPSFVVDCLETLEEINIRLREQWLSLGGESFQRIPCLNASDVWVNHLALKNKALQTANINALLETTP